MEGVEIVSRPMQALAKDPPRGKVDAWLQAGCGEQCGAWWYGTKFADAREADVDPGPHGPDPAQGRRCCSGRELPGGVALAAHLWPQLADLASREHGGGLSDQLRRRTRARW